MTNLTIGAAKPQAQSRRNAGPDAVGVPAEPAPLWLLDRHRPGPRLDPFLFAGARRLAEGHFFRFRRCDAPRPGAGSSARPKLVRPDGLSARSAPRRLHALVAPHRSAARRFDQALLPRAAAGSRRARDPPRLSLGAAGAALSRHGAARESLDRAGSDPAGARSSRF